MNFFKNSLLLFFSTVIVLAFIEIICTIFFEQSKSESWRIQDENGLYINKRSGFSEHEFIGKNQKIKVTYNFGKYGNRIILNDIYKSNEKKILVLGDSFGFGWLTEDDKNFISLIQKKYTQLYFINSSAGGLGDADLSVYLTNYCKKISPSKILFFIHVDRSINSEFYKLDKNNNLIFKKKPINKIKKYLENNTIYNFLSKHSNFFQLVKQTYLKQAKFTINKPYQETEDTIKNSQNNKSITTEQKKNSASHIEKKKYLMDQIYKKIIKDVKNCESEIIFINIGWSDNETIIKKYVLQNFYKNYVSNNEDVDFINLYDDLEYLRKNKKNFQLEEGHPNDEGHLYIAEKLLIKLEDLLKNY